MLDGQDQADGDATIDRESTGNPTMIEPAEGPENEAPDKNSDAAIHFCADGGANRLYHAFEDNEERERYIPDYICGDFDSIDTAVKDWYAAKGTIIDHSKDQDTTDFQKCLMILNNVYEPTPQNDTPPPETSTLSRLLFPHCLSPALVSAESSPPSSSKYEVVVLGALSGRFDHIMSSIHTLFMVAPERKVYLVSSESVAFLLRPGMHDIRCNKEIEGPTCGLIPIGVTTARVVTQGLKWNVDQSTPLSFCSLVSTSNAFAEDSGNEPVVHVETDAPVVWTVEVNMH
ncbi:thiamine diphosphokinase [Spizellomyces sp. 'palustris']|nr:thiamine diphosphokinase [Spizellomyces sp. 'palustris']